MECQLFEGLSVVRCVMRAKDSWPHLYFDLNYSRIHILLECPVVESRDLSSSRLFYTGQVERHCARGHLPLFLAMRFLADSLSVNSFFL